MKYLLINTLIAFLVHTHTGMAKENGTRHPSSLKDYIRIIINNKPQIFTSNLNSQVYYEWDSGENSIFEGRIESIQLEDIEMLKKNSSFSDISNNTIVALKGIGEFFDLLRDAKIEKIKIRPQKYKIDPCKNNTATMRYNKTFEILNNNVLYINVPIEEKEVELEKNNVKLKDSFKGFHSDDLKSFILKLNNNTYSQNKLNSVFSLETLSKRFPAHSGPTDCLGCHYDQYGIYHCH